MNLGGALPAGWMLHQITAAGRRFELAGPAEPDTLLDGLREADLESTSPYWAALWPAAVKLAEFVLRHDWPPGARALELGCGLGLVGIAGLAAGLRVTFSDLVPLAVSTASHNAVRNGLQPSAGIVLDWRSPLAAAFPIVLGSDVLYDLDLQVPLLGTLEAVLSAGGVCWLADPGRSTVESFVVRAGERGYAVAIWDEQGQSLSSPIGSFQRLRLTRE